MKVELLHLNPVRRGSLRAYASVSLSDAGLALHGIRISAGPWGVAVHLPQRILVDAEGLPVRDDIGQIVYRNLATFTEHATWLDFRASVLAAVRAADPELLADDPVAAVVELRDRRCA